MPKSYKYYAVAFGHQTGVFMLWSDAKAAIEGYPHAIYQGFNSLEEAHEFVARGGARSKRDWAEIRATSCDDHGEHTSM
ncbi:unnamed protein product [Tilletia laevis]|uniref:Ribonuclease H1 N-terminal domain-containing protein n=2 Tax=Tilletia TaxID=13289 RepID=A0A177VGP9_9BASI|nr:hypothetical protein CF336_g2861 [Tilletia laevis]KAE8262362.1 hypothetical protein A4X03_0g2515 [Tilletia caries]CAD6977837.1 unnamed protein product [Tilletia controversa]KAE8206235.1 hypothetical protein CF335_g2029 [Tilletia laevis]CAD6890054.1 unnamed protein product [Tilletia caries]